MEKEGTHELARDILDRTEEVLGVRKMLLNKKRSGEGDGDVPPPDRTGLPHGQAADPRGYRTADVRE